MNYDKYIGLPYKNNGRDAAGVDCWGLVCLFYKDELGIELPSYIDDYVGPNDPSVVSLVNSYKDQWTSTTTPNVGNVVLFNILGEPTHVGVYVGNNKFLHARDGKDVVIESLNNVKWTKRLEGIYEYTTGKQVEVVGVPHPLKTQIYRDWTVAGTTVLDFVNFTKQKYNTSTRFINSMRLVVDGVPVPQSEWATTILQPGQTIAYRAVAEGNNTFRMALMIAVAAYAGPAAGGLGFTAGTAAYSATQIGLTMAGMALVNAIMPIRQPTMNDPGQAGTLNLFTGSANQANKFGSIPVVLGKVRMTGLLGANAYVESLTDTTVLNLLVVWGFGPLSITDICVGANPIVNYYQGLPQDIPQPVNLSGIEGEDTVSFDKLYGNDVEQAFKQVELANLDNSTHWESIEFIQESTRVDVALSFPEGMRQINTENGDVNQTLAEVELQLGVWNGSAFDYSTTATSPFAMGNYASPTPSATALIDFILPSFYDNPTTQEHVPLYRYTLYVMLPGGGTRRIDGAATDNKYGNPSSALQQIYRNGSYQNLLPTDSTSNNIVFDFLPSVPNGCKKLYLICTYGNDSIVEITDTTVLGTGVSLSNNVVSYLDDYLGHQGLAIVPTRMSEEAPEGGPILTGQTRITIASGRLYTPGSTNPVSSVPETIWTTRDFAGLPAGNATDNAPILRDWGVWNVGNTDDTNFDHVMNVTFQYSGYYNIEAAADDFGAVYINTRKILDIPNPGFFESVSALEYIEAGTYPVRVTATNTAGRRSVAVKITYNPSGINSVATTYTALSFGNPGFFYKRKNPFNFVYRFRDLPKARYSVRVRRTNSSDAAPTGQKVQNYFKVILYNAVCFNNSKPMVNPPGCYLARSAIRVQSSNTANGSIDGVNAMLETIAWEWDSTANSWIKRATNNPAALFCYVLMHPANAFKMTIADVASKIDLDKIKYWTDFCKGNNFANIKFTYNTIISNTSSVMDVLRDICAAGMASPIYVDGKWSVVIDEPRSHTTQYFTQHNSWGFESTKALPRLPHAFRITINDENLAYQPKEYYVYNYGYGDGTNGTTPATLFETLTLPGVTNADQAKFMARWHLAQIVLRPETYTLNTDFEYLVCQRGDVVKVVHEVPQWGIGSGRIKTITNSTTLVLTEPMYLTAGVSYGILIRTNSQTTPDGIAKTLTAITTTGWYDTVTLSTAIISGDNIEVDNLFLLGTSTSVSHQLVVLSIEPTTSVGAKLTLVDYSPEIYTKDLSQLLVYNSDITPTSTYVVQNTINFAPIISQITSDSALSEQISGNTYQNVLLISFSNRVDLSKNAEKIQVQVIAGDADFTDNALEGIYVINKDQSSLTVTGLKTNSTYKVRARYTSGDQKITGPWSDTYYTVNSGKNTNNFSINTTLVMDLAGTFITATPTVLVATSDFDHYEFRMIKDTGTEDIWDYTGTTVMTDVAVGKFDLTKQTKPRISFAGVSYRVACRAVDKNGNYSDVSALGTIVVKTIQ